MTPAQTPISSPSSSDVEVSSPPAKEKRGKGEKRYYIEIPNDTVSLLFSLSFEQYRKHKLCPVSGCKAKPQKKLSYHIILYHPHITPKKRRSLCRNARTVNKMFIKPLKAQKKLFFSAKGRKVERLLNLERPNPMDEKNSTRAMKAFPEEN